MRRLAAVHQPEVLSGVRILLVEDARETRGLIAKALSEDGCLVTAVGSGEAASAALRETEFQLVILDLGLPDGDGITRCRRWREGGLRLPILILTARAEVASRVAGLDAGADDYLYKPFALAELRARLRALLRRGAGAEEEPIYRHGTLRVDFARRLVHRGSVEVPITRREMEVLDRLARAGGRAVSREDLLDEIWGLASEHAAQSLEVIIGRLRRKLDAPGSEQLIRTIRGHGYALARSEPEGRK